MRQTVAKLFFALAGSSCAFGAVASPVSFALASEPVVDTLRPISATPLDPTGQPQDTFFSGHRYSARRMAIDIIINGWRAHSEDDDRFGRALFEPVKPRSRWRVRASLNRVMIRYEVSF